MFANPLIYFQLVSIYFGETSTRAYVLDKNFLSATWP